MADNIIQGFPTPEGTARYDYGALANVPEPLKEMPAATVGQYLVVEEVDTEGKIKKVKTVAGPDSTQNANGLSDTAKTLLITILRNGRYNTDQSANITALEAALASSGDSGETELVPSSITATYSGGEVAVGTAVADLTGIVVTATYSDGSTATVTDYTLSGEIAEGSNTITVSYGGKTTTFTVTGVADAPEVVTYTVTSGLTNVESTNPSAVVNEGESYTATLTAADGYELDSVVVTMGGVDITATAYADGAIAISAITGDVVITAVAVEEVEEVTYPFTPDEAYAITWADGYIIDSTTGADSENASFSASDYLPVAGASAVTLGSGVYTNYGVFFYTEDKTWLCRHNVNLAYPASVPRNAAYLRISARTTGKANAAVTPHVYELLGEQTVWESGKYYGVAYHPGISLNASTGAEAAAESWWASGHCFCYGAETLTVCEYNTSYRCALVFYDAEKNYISGDTNTNRVNVAIPENAVYFRIAAGMITSTDARFGTDNPWITLS